MLTIEPQGEPTLFLNRYLPLKVDWDEGLSDFLIGIIIVAAGTGYDVHIRPFTFAQWEQIEKTNAVPKNYVSKPIHFKAQQSKSIYAKVVEALEAAAKDSLFHKELNRAFKQEGTNFPFSGMVCDTVWKYLNQATQHD